MMCSQVLKVIYILVDPKQILILLVIAHLFKEVYWDINPSIEQSNRSSFRFPIT